MRNMTIMRKAKTKKLYIVLAFLIYAFCLLSMHLFFVLATSKKAYPDNISIWSTISKASDLEGFEIHYDNISRCPNGEDVCAVPDSAYQGLGADQGDSPILVNIVDSNSANSLSTVISGLEGDWFISVKPFDKSGNIGEPSNQITTKPPQGITIYWNCN